MFRRSTSATVVVSLAFASPAFAAIRFFPSDTDTGDDTIDYDIGAFSMVVVGYKPDFTQPDSYPFPNTAKATEHLTVVDNGMVNGKTYVFNDSVLDVNGGTMSDIWLSYDPYLQAPFPNGAAGDVNLAGGTTGSIYGAYHNQIVIRAGTAYDVETHNSGDILMAAGTVHSLTAYDQSTATMVGGTAGSISGTGASTLTLSGGTVNSASAGDGSVLTISGGTVSGDVAALGGDDSSSGGQVSISDGNIGSLVAQGEGFLILNGGTVSGGARVSDQASIKFAGGTVSGAVSVSGTGVLSIGGTQITGGVSASDHSQVLAGDAGGSIQGGVTASGNAKVNLSQQHITGTVDMGDYTTANLTHCVVLSGGINAHGNTEVDINGQSVIFGDVFSNDTSIVTISGSSINGDVVAAHGQINFNGAIINGNVLVLGGLFNYSGGVIVGNEGGAAGLSATSITSPDVANTLHIDIEDGGVVNFYGTNFTSELINAHYTGGYSEYELSGTLADGTVISGGTFLVLNNSGSTFALLPPVPEPTALSLLLSGSVGLLRRRRSA